MAANPFDQFDVEDSGNPFDQFDQPGAASPAPIPQQQPAVNTMADSQARGLPPLEMPNAFGLMKPAPVKAPPISQQLQEAGDTVGGMATGLVAQLPGVFGDIESFGRLALSPLGGSRENWLPTSERMGDIIAGPPATEAVAGGRTIGNLLSPIAALMGAKLASKTNMVAGKGTLPAATAAREAGYVIPPNMAQKNPSLVSKALSGWGGKIKTQQAASEKNQSVTSKLAARELGIDPNTTLTDKAFRDVRAQAGQAYEAVKQVPQPIVADAEYAAQIAKLGNRTGDAAEHFPGIVKNDDIEKLASGLSQAQQFPASAAIEVVKELRHKATLHLRSADDPAKVALGQAQRSAADAIDDLVERNLTALGNPEIVANYRSARQLIAKSHDVEAATNTATGEVSARALARIGGKKPLTGGLSQIANAGEAFPKAMQDVSAFGGTESHSVLDMILAAGSAGMGRLDLAGAIAGRPLARASVLSNPYQNLALGSRAATVSGVGITGMDPRLLAMMSPQLLAQLLAAQSTARQ